MALQATVGSFAFGREIEALLPSLLLMFNRRTNVEFCTSARLTQNCLLQAGIFCQLNAPTNCSGSSGVKTIFLSEIVVTNTALFLLVAYQVILPIFLFENRPQ